MIANTYTGAKDCCCSRGESLMRVFKRMFILAMFLTLAGCGHVISENLRKEVDPALTFKEVFSKPAAYQGKQVIWGGEIIETANQKDGGSLIEVFQRPLNFRGEPDEDAKSEGRFMARIETYLDPYIYRKGRKITVAGEVLGERVKPVGEMDYRYPVIAGRQIYLWEEYQPYVYPYVYPYPYFYGGWYYSPYYPWWGYPYRYRR
jgi:outer membrane lipoprotein